MDVKTPVTAVPGDGIGPEITAATLGILKAAGCRVVAEVVDLEKPVHDRASSYAISSAVWEFDFSNPTVAETALGSAQRRWVPKPPPRVALDVKPIGQRPPDRFRPSLCQVWASINVPAQFHVTQTENRYRFDYIPGYSLMPGWVVRAMVGEYRSGGRGTSIS